MQKDSSSLSRSSSSSPSLRQYQNSSNPNFQGSCFTPKNYKNKEFKWPIHRRMIQKNNQVFNPVKNRKEKRTKVRAISVKKAKNSEPILKKSRSGEPFNKSSTEYQQYNTELTLVEPQIGEKDTPMIQTMEITEMSEEIDFSIWSEGSEHRQEFPGVIECRSNSSGQYQIVMKGVESLRVENSPAGFSMEVQENAQNAHKTSSNRPSRHSCHEFGEDKVERVRRSTYDEVSGEQEEIKLESKL